VNRSLLLLVLSSAAAAIVACTSTTATNQEASPNDPSGEEQKENEGSTSSTSSGGSSSGSSKPKSDGGSTSSSSSSSSSSGKPNYGDGGYDPPPPPPPPVDAGPTVTAFTKAEVQTLVNARCTPCHITQASAGMSLANDFTTNTVNVNSSQVATLKRIKPGSKDQSYLFHKIKGTHATVGGTGLRMPRNGPPYLTDTEIARIGAFIDAL
jgi:hypothetical protein